MRRGLKTRTERRPVAEPELLTEFNKQALPAVSWHDQIAQLGIIAGLLTIACLAWRYLP